MRLYKRGRVWWARYFDATTRRIERASTRCTDKTAAEAIARQLERHGADPAGQAAATATLGDALDAMILEYEHRARERRSSSATVEFYRKRAGQLLRMVAEGHLPPMLQALSARTVDAMIDTRRAEGSKPATIAKDLITLRLALKLAKRRGEWAGDIDAVVPAFSPQYRPVERWLPPHELAALIAELPPHRGAVVAFAVATGANLSEWQKSRREDVRSDRVLLHGTKRKERERAVPIVYPWQRALLTAALSAVGDGSLFTRWQNVNRDLKEAAKRAGVAPLSTNDLRRTFGTWARADGAALKDLAPAMGHSTTRMVETVYARLDVEQVAKLLRTSVPDLYASGSDRAHPADQPDSPDAEICRDFGSSCWTRTSDPVINSRRSSCIYSVGWIGCCAAGVRTERAERELRGLAKGVAALDLWDLLEVGS